MYTTYVKGIFIKILSILNLERTCRESHDEGLAMLAEVNGMIADYALADCQTGNPDLWVALTSHPMMENCMCLDPLTGAVIRHDHDCSQSCDQYSSGGLTF